MWNGDDLDETDRGFIDTSTASAQLEDPKDSRFG